MNTQSILLLSRALLRDKQARRKIMFYSCIVTMVLAFSGVFLLMNTLQKSPWLFLGYWALCFGSILFMLLLALYDLLAVRAQHKVELRKLRKSMQEAVEKKPES